MAFQWFLPSMYGDIKLERVSSESTRLVVVGLSPTEKDAIRSLLKRASKASVLQKPWLETGTIDLDSMGEQSLVLNAPITKVQNVLQASLKPHRKQISAVLFTSGKIEQVSEATLQTIDAGPAATTSSTADTTTPEMKTEEPKAAVTVAQPVLGCPAPDFDDVEVRATRVLRAFLSPQQIADFERRQQFVAVGADTGHRYLLTSRHSKHGLANASYRSLYDIDEKQALCVHDWEVPASEELLGLFVHLSLPGLERYVRSIPDRDGLLA